MNAKNKLTFHLPHNKSNPVLQLKRCLIAKFGVSIRKIKVCHGHRVHQSCHYYVTFKF